MLVQASEQSFTKEQIEVISILQPLLDIWGIQYDSSGTFQGEIREMETVQPEFRLEFVELLVKVNDCTFQETYFSRRDQYKVLKVLHEKITHVYSRKFLYFDEIKLEVTTLMKNNSEVVKSGLIDNNTKIIFRSACAKSTILIEIAKETFELNSSRQIYL